MISIARISLFTAASLVVAAAAFGQIAPPAADLSGTWILTSEQQLSPPRGALTTSPAPEVVQLCAFQGTADVSQGAKGDLSGEASLNLVTGSPPCPDTMEADLTGGVEGTNVTMGMLMGALGTATFDGMINLPKATTPTGGEDRAVGNVAAPQLAGVTVTGSSLVTQGNFLLATGPFTAVPQLAVIEVPTLTGVGLVLLVLLLLGSATFILLRRRVA